MNQAVTLKLPDVEQDLRYGFAYWSATLASLLTTHRLKAPREQRYTADAIISERLSAKWHSLFDVKPEDTDPIPFLYYQSVGTLLYTRIFADLGINFRNLLHVKHETLHLMAPSACASVRRNRLDCGLKHVKRLGKDKALVSLETHIYGPGETPLSVVQDSFLIRKLPSHDLNNLDSDATAVWEMRALRVRAAELDMRTEGTRHCSMSVTPDMGRSYGKVSGDMNPVHTTRLGARLFGLPRPFLQGLGVRNLTIRHLARMGVPLDHLSLTFASPAYLGETLNLIVRDGRFEVQDSRRCIVAHGVATGVTTKRSFLKKSWRKPPDKTSGAMCRRIGTDVSAGVRLRIQRPACTIAPAPSEPGAPSGAAARIRAWPHTRSDRASSGFPEMPRHWALTIFRRA
jgi:acyl dehydratase